MKIITNNPKVNNDLAMYDINYYDCDYGQVLNEVRKEIVDNKVVLLSHPLSGSIKPNETFYKSIMVEDNKLEYIDATSLDYIEQAIEVYDKFIGCKARPKWTEQILMDFAVVDYFLIKSAINSKINI
jgi:hypothetical protein